MSKHSSTSGGGPMNPDIDTLSGAYALNALDEAEREAFEARLADDPDLRQETAELTDTALLLGYAVEPITPSPALRASVLDLIGSTPQLPRLSAPDVTDVAQERRPAADAPGASTEAEILEPIPLARQRWFMRPGVLLIGAAAAVGLFFGGVGMANQFTPSPSTSSAPIAAGDVGAILAASDVQHTASDLSTGGKATLYWSNDLQRSAVVVNGATALPSGKTYQLWYIKGSDVKSAGTMAVNGNSVTQVLQGDLQKGDTVGITVEPAGGSKQPTSTPVVALQSA